MIASRPNDERREISDSCDTDQPQLEFRQDSEFTGFGRLNRCEKWHRESQRPPTARQSRLGLRYVILGASDASGRRTPLTSACPCIRNCLKGIACLKRIACWMVPKTGVRGGGVAPNRQRSTKARWYRQATSKKPRLIGSTVIVPGERSRAFGYTGRVGVPRERVGVSVRAAPERAAPLRARSASHAA